MRNISDKSYRKNQNTHFVFSNFLFENRTVYEIMRKNIAEGVGHRGQYGACPLHAGYLRLQIHTLRLCNAHCFSTVTVVARTRLDVTLYVLLVLVVVYSIFLLLVVNYTSFPPVCLMRVELYCADVRSLS